MTDLETKLDKMAWSVPEGWTAERLMSCSRCHDTVLLARIGHGTMLKFDRDGSDHGFSCPGAPRMGVGRSWKGQHGGKRDWETK
jgi:hypothetical protein